MTPSPAPRASGAHRLESALAILGAAALFGTTGTSQALGPGGTTPLGVGGVRLLVGAAVLIAIAALEPRAPGAPRWRAQGWALLLGGAAVAAYQLTLFAGLRRTGVALGTIVGIGSGPVFAGLIHLARTRRGLSRSWTLGTALTVIGAALLAARGAGDASADPLGIVLVLGAGLSYALYANAAKHLIHAGFSPARSMAGIFGAGALLVLPLTLAEPLAWLATPRGLAMALHLGVLTIGLAYWLYGLGLRHLAVPTVVTLNLAEPLTAATLGVAVLGERLGARGWVGAAVIVAGLLLASRAEEPERATAEMAGT